MTSELFDKDGPELSEALASTIETSSSKEQGILRKNLKLIAAVGAATLALVGGAEFIAIKYFTPKQETKITHIGKNRGSPGKSKVKIFSGKPVVVSGEDFLRRETVQTARIVSRLDQNYKVHESPFRALKSRSDRRLSEGDKIFEEAAITGLDTLREAFSNKFVEAIELGNGMKVNIYAYEKDGFELKVNPQGVVDMFNYELASIPSLPDSKYKTWAMKFFRKAENKDLTNIEANFFVSTVPNTCPEVLPMGFKKGSTERSHQTYTSCEALGVTYDIMPKESVVFNLPIIVARPDAKPSQDEMEGVVGIAMHEFAHGIVSVMGDHDDTAQEHDQFVIPLSLSAAARYGQAVRESQAQPAFEFSKTPR